MTYMQEPRPAAAYEGNAASVKVRFRGWRLVNDDAILDEDALLRPEGHIGRGRSTLERALGTGGAGVVFYFAVFHSQFINEAVGSLPYVRFLLWLLCVSLIDVLLFHGHRAASLAVSAEAQEDSLKWMEGMEIGQMNWVEMNRLLLFSGGEDAPGGAGGSGGRRLLVGDRLGQRLLFDERDLGGGAFDALLARLRLERPDLKTRVVSAASAPAVSEPNAAG